jgi:hypothetical protein
MTEEQKAIKRIEDRKIIKELLEGKTEQESSELVDYAIELHNDLIRRINEDVKNNFSIGDKVIVKSKKAGTDFEGVIEKIMVKNIRVRRLDVHQMWDCSPALLTKI